MDISSLFMASPIFGGYSNFLNNFGSALGSNLVTYPLQKKMADRQYEYQLRLQQQAQAHQINMYKHQHQWRVEDLRSAGLNPILSTHAASAMPSASSGSVGLGSPSVGSSSALNVDSLARLFHGRYKKENELLDAQINSAKAAADKDLLLAGKYASETMSENAQRAFEYSPEVRELKKRKIYNEGTKNLWQSYGDFQSRIDSLTGYNPYSAKSNALHGKVIPVKKNSRKSSLSRLK